MTKGFHHLIKIIYTFLSSLPALFIICFYTEVARLYFILGRFPKFNDPSSKLVPIQDKLLTALTLWNVFLAIPWLVITVIAVTHQKITHKNIFSNKFIRFNIALYIGSIAALILIAGLDPTTSWEWFWD